MGPHLFCFFLQHTRRHRRKQLTSRSTSFKHSHPVWFPSCCSGGAGGGCGGRLASWKHLRRSPWKNTRWKYIFGPIMNFKRLSSPKTCMFNEKHYQSSWKAFCWVFFSSGNCHKAQTKTSSETRLFLKKDFELQQHQTKPFGQTNDFAPSPPTVTVLVVVMVVVVWRPNNLFPCGCHHGSLVNIQF